jgi:hypothetical protein
MHNINDVYAACLLPAYQTNGVLILCPLCSSGHRPLWSIFSPGGENKAFIGQRGLPHSTKSPLPGVDTDIDDEGERERLGPRDWKQIIGISQRRQATEIYHSKKN